MRSGSGRIGSTGGNSTGSGTRVLVVTLRTRYDGTQVGVTQEQCLTPGTFKKVKLKVLRKRKKFF